MGCCGSTAAPAMDDAPPPALTPRQVRLWTELDAVTLVSSARSASVPSRCYLALRQRALVFHAGVTHGITGATDNAPYGKVYEAFVPPVLRPSQRLRVVQWLNNVK